MSINSIWYNVTVEVIIFLLIVYLDDLPIDVSGVVTFLIIIILL